MTPSSQPSHLPLDATTRGHMPSAAWMVGGAFRFDSHLLTICHFLNTYYPPRAVACVAGTPPCAWALEMRGARAMLSLERYVSLLRFYAEYKVGVVLVFDNPALAADSLQDVYAHRLVSTLLESAHNPTNRNAVCVASDELAACLHERYPQLRIICHPNRLITAAVKRTPEYYEALEKKYHSIILHPRDAVSPALYTKLRHAGRYAAVVNDPTPRNYPLRRELLHLYAELHRRPWDGQLHQSLERMLRTTGLTDTSNTCNLTRNEEAALYEAGVRSFVVQASLLRNEITLFYDMMYHLLRTTPEHSNKAALIASAGMAHIRELEAEPPSGLNLFSLSDFK